MFTGCIETEYRNNQRLIHHVVHLIHNKYGGIKQDLEEMGMGWLFMKAVITYDPNRKTKFSTHLYKVIWDDLASFRRTECRRAKIIPMEDMELNEYREYSKFNFQEFLEDLTEDAQALIFIAFDPPPSVIIKKNNMPRLDSLRRYTTKQLKWSAEQFQEAVQEIRSAI